MTKQICVQLFITLEIFIQCQMTNKRTNFQNQPFPGETFTATTIFKAKLIKIIILYYLLLQDICIIYMCW